MKKIVLALVMVALVAISAITLLKDKNQEPDSLTILKEKYSHKDSSSVDHTQFAELKKKFNHPQEVTEACLSCHNGRDSEVMKSNHWNWESVEYIEGRGIVYLGKKNAINNFCIGIEGNEQSCAKCHIGYGMTSSMFSFTDAKNIDCLVCHDQTESYI
ncbi:MAG TPA: cytochrome C, partial [Ignavibacteriaceae bacterium]